MDSGEGVGWTGMSFAAGKGGVGDDTVKTQPPRSGAGWQCHGGVRGVDGAVAGAGCSMAVAQASSLHTYMWVC